MGVVDKAEDLKLKRSVALFLPHLMDSSESKDRFLTEAEAAAALSHPNICVIHEVGESETVPSSRWSTWKARRSGRGSRKGRSSPGRPLASSTRRRPVWGGPRQGHYPQRH